MSDQPKVLETTVNFSGGGKVAIVDYGKISSDYHGSVTRKYAVPADWSDEDTAAFEVEIYRQLRDQLEPLLDEEFKERYERREWQDERGASVR